MSGIILDLIVVVVVVLLLIFGIWRGAYKMIFGLVSSLLAIVLSIVLLSTVTGFIVERTTLDERLVGAIEEPLLSGFNNPDTTINYYDIDNDGVAAELGYYDNETDQIHPFADLLNGTNFGLFSGVLENVVKSQVDASGENTGVVFGAALSNTVVGYIISAIVFLILLIVFAIIVKLIMMLIKKLVTVTYAGHFINKVLGAALGLVVAAVIVFGVLAVIRMLGTYEWIIPVNRVIEDSTITKLLFDNNFIYDFIVERVNLTDIIDGMLGGVAASGGTAAEGAINAV